MTKDEALKMAVEFMETLTIDVGIKTWNEKHRKEAIQACKEALEQPAQDFFERGKEIAKWADKQNEQPAQEPVAWMSKDEAFEKFWNTEIVSAVTGSVDTAMWGNIDRNDTAFIFMAGFNACKEQPAQEPIHNWTMERQMNFPFLKAKERLIRIMGTFDLATGHANTFDELLDSLESELRDVLGHYRAAFKEHLTQEPWGWYDNHDIYNAKQSDESIPLYTHPAPSWQGLSDDEIDKEALKGDHAAYFALGALWANQALKEKNYV